MSNNVIGPDHPLVKSGVIKLDRIVTREISSKMPREDDNSTDVILGYPSKWGVPQHPPTHEGRSDPETTNDDSDSPAPVRASLGFAAAAFGKTPLGSKSPSQSSTMEKTSTRQRNKGESQKRRKKNGSGNGNANANANANGTDTTVPIKRVFSSVKGKWFAAKNVVGISSYMLSQKMERSQSAPEGVGVGVGKKRLLKKKNKRSKGIDKDKQKEKEKQHVNDAEIANSEMGILSDMAPCPSPSHIRGVERKTGLIEPRTVWNPSPHSHHIAEHGMESTTMLQSQMALDAKNRSIRHAKREKKKRAKEKRQQLLKRKLKAHAKTVRAIFRFSKMQETDDNGNMIEKIVATVVKENEATKEDLATQSDDVKHAVADGNGELKVRKLTKLEIEEREEARREALRQFKEEQARLVEKERKEREARWQLDWKNMHETRLDDSVPGRTSAAQETVVITEEEKKKKKKQLRDKNLMRQQRKRIRKRKELKIQAQEQLHRLSKEHDKWVKSELKKDAILASGKHLGVEEMLFVVQARNSEQVHAGYTNHVSNEKSRNVVPVNMIHPSFYGYTMVKRTKTWQEDAQIDEKRKEEMVARQQRALILKEKKNKKTLLKRAKLDAQNGSRKDRRNYAKQQEENKKLKKADKKQQEQQTKITSSNQVPTYTEEEKLALMTVHAKKEYNYHIVHPSYCGEKVLKKLKEKQPDTIILIEGKEVIMVKAQPGTVLAEHPGCIHKITMQETMAVSKYTTNKNRIEKEVEDIRSRRHLSFLTKYEQQNDVSHTSWLNIWQNYEIRKTVCNVQCENPIYFQRQYIPLHPPTPPATPREIYEPPLRWGKPQRCIICQAPPGVLGRPGCPGCFESKARLPWTFPLRTLPEIYPPPFERNHGIVRLKKKRKKTKDELKKRRNHHARKQSSIDLEMQSQSAIIDSANLNTKSVLDLEVEQKKKRKEAQTLDLATQAGLLRAAKLANYHTPMIDRKALLQHRRSGGINYITVWVKTIPGGTCVRLVLDKHETIERLRFLFLTNSGEYGPESWGYMVLPTDKGCYFLDSRIRYKSELRLGYRPGDRNLTEYGVGEPNAGEEVVILMVSAGGGRTELNLRTMSEMLRRYFFQNANIEHDRNGKPMYLPTNIIERIMKGRWGTEGASRCFPGTDNAQKQLIGMCKNQLRIKREAFEADMEDIRTLERRQRELAYKEHLKRSLDIKMKSYKLLQNSLTEEKQKLMQLDHAEMLQMIDNMDMRGGQKMTTTDILRKGKRSAKKRRLENRLREIRQKEKRFVASTKARTLANHDEIPMYVFRKWQPPPLPPPPPPPPPRRPGILTRFAKGTYKYLLKPIRNGVVGTVRRIKELRQAIKEAANEDEFESDSDEEEQANGGESDDEMLVEEKIDVFAMGDDEEDDEE